jgi:hypothetical protein
MTSPFVRRGLAGAIALAVAAAIAVPAMAASAPLRRAGHPRVGALGVLPVEGGAANRTDGAPRASRGLRRAPNLVYHHGPVMRTSTTYAIYWQPATGDGAPFFVDPAYNTDIDRYFADNQAASEAGAADNVYSTLKQYYDTLGSHLRHHVKYAQTFGGSYVDTAPFPANGCLPYSSFSVCLTDKQIRGEIKSVMAANGWTGGRGHAFFLMLPKDVGTCFDTTRCAFTWFCAYHSAFWGDAGPVIYANIPYAGTRLAACGTPSWPNAPDVDSALDSISHEHREMTNDPLGNAWYDQTGYEGSDKCAHTYGTPHGTAPSGEAFNQLINGNYYFVQREWSNKTSSCVQFGR